MGAVKMQSVETSAAVSAAVKARQRATPPPERRTPRNDETDRIEKGRVITTTTIITSTSMWCVCAIDRVEKKKKGGREWYDRSPACFCFVVPPKRRDVLSYFIMLTRRLATQRRGIEHVYSIIKKAYNTHNIIRS